MWIGHVLANCARMGGSSAIFCHSRPVKAVGMPTSRDLDAIDGRIIAALQADGRLTNVDLAERVGLSPSPCLRRTKRLEREGYIDAYRAVLQRNQVGLGLTVFVEIKISAHANQEAEAFQNAIVALHEV